jgi:hypothetical protein
LALYVASTIWNSSKDIYAAMLQISSTHFSAHGNGYS